MIYSTARANELAAMAELRVHIARRDAQTLAQNRLEGEGPIRAAMAKLAQARADKRDAEPDPPRSVMWESADDGRPDVKLSFGIMCF